MKHPYAIRLATEADAEALSEAGRKAFVENFGHLYSNRDLQVFLDGAYTPALQLEEIQDPQNCVLVAEYEGRFVGYAKAGPCKLPVPHASENAFELHRIYILSEAKGQGIGSALMQKVMKFFHKKAASDVFLGVWSQNYAAQKFYAHYGFIKVAEYHFTVGEQADDEWIMQLQNWQPNPFVRL